MKKKRRPGAPITLSDEIQKKIVNGLAAGNYICTVCDWAGIGVTTFYYWMERGKDALAAGKKVKPEERQFIEFLKAVQKAQAEAEMKLVMSIEKQANGRPAEFNNAGEKIRSEIPADWRAAGWILERKFQDRWGRREQVKVFEAEEGESFKPDGSYEKFLESIEKIERKKK